jgi:predicted mannosyl-3-phosphoglycerate phosphatase (HAD superfamily)
MSLSSSRSRSRREDNFKMILNEMDWNVVDGSRLAHVTDSGVLL